MSHTDATTAAAEAARPLDARRWAVHLPAQAAHADPVPAPRGSTPPRAANGATYQGPTYYGQPAVKASNYGVLVWGYTWLAGLAGSSQLLGAIADLRGGAGRGLVRQARWTAALAPLPGAAMLVADLHTPGRWFNMLRIFRRTSPMSIGSYVLGSFSLASLVTALADAAGWRRVARVAQVPAAAAGAGMSVYTGALLAATSTPLWAAAPRQLTGRFACSAFATAAAALSIGETLRGNQRQAAALDCVAALAVGVEFALTRSGEQRQRAAGVDGSLHEPGPAAAQRAGQVVGTALPLLCVALNSLSPRRSPALSLVGALGVLAGGMMMRAHEFQAGNRSARRPQDTFALARAQD